MIENLAIESRDDNTEYPAILERIVPRARAGRECPSSTFPKDILCPESGTYLL